MLKTSVLVCTYNGEKYIKEQLDSIINQTIKPDEIIVVDDCSTDSTVDIVNDILKQNVIYYKVLINENNLGVTKNFEKAVLHASNDIVFFSDQDDVWVNNKIQICLDNFENNENLNLIFTDAMLVDENMLSLNKSMWQHIKYTTKKFSQKKFLNDILYKTFVTGATMSCRINFLKKITPFPSNLFHDEWIALMAKSTGDVLAINQKLIHYRQHSNNVVGAQAVSLDKKVEVYISKFKIIEQIREKKCERFNLCLATNLFSGKNLRKLQKCNKYWNDMLSLKKRNFFVGHMIIFKNLINFNYFKYTSGIKVYFRDFVCQFIK